MREKPIPGKTDPGCARIGESLGGGEGRGKEEVLFLSLLPARPHPPRVHGILKTHLH